MRAGAPTPGGPLGRPAPDLAAPRSTWGVVVGMWAIGGGLGGSKRPLSALIACLRDGGAANEILDRGLILWFSGTATLHFQNAVAPASKAAFCLARVGVHAVSGANARGPWQSGGAANGTANQASCELRRPSTGRRAGCGGPNPPLPRPRMAGSRVRAIRDPDPKW